MSTVLFSKEWFRSNPDCTDEVIKTELSRLKRIQQKLFTNLQGEINALGLSWHSIETMAADWFAAENLYTEWVQTAREAGSLRPKATPKGVFTCGIEAKIAFYKEQQKTDYEQGRLQSLMASYQYKDNKYIMTLLAQYHFTCHTLPLLIARLQERLGERLGLDPIIESINKTHPQIFIVV